MCERERENERETERDIEMMGGKGGRKEGYEMERANQYTRTYSQL